MTEGAERVLAAARERIERVRPEDLAAIRREGGLVVDIRPQAQRELEGELPDAVVIERNVLEWRLDPAGQHRLDLVTDPRQRIVVVCSEGYASSLAAASLRDVGLERAADLEGGYVAWAAHVAASSGS